MKLANALSQRSDVQNRLDELRARLNNNARVQEGEEPAEDPKALLAELDTLCAQLEDLVARINLTNATTVAADGVTLTAKLARRDALKEKLGLMRSFLDAASHLAGRTMRTEIKVKPTVPVAKLQKQVDALSKELRELDEQIQELNWTTELL